MTICEKVAYLKGMFDGMALDVNESKEAKLIAAMLDVLEEIGLSIEDLEDTCDALGEEVDAISDDLSDVEDVVFEEEDEEEDEDFDDEDLVEEDYGNDFDDDFNDED